MPKTTTIDRNNNNNNNNNKNNKSSADGGGGNGGGGGGNKKKKMKTKKQSVENTILNVPNNNNNSSSKKIMKQQHQQLQSSNNDGSSGVATGTTAANVINDGTTTSENNNNNNNNDKSRTLLLSSNYEKNTVDEEDDNDNNDGISPFPSPEVEPDAHIDIDDESPEPLCLGLTQEQQQQQAEGLTQEQAEVAQQAAAIASEFRDKITPLRNESFGTSAFSHILTNLNNDLATTSYDSTNNDNNTTTTTALTTTYDTTSTHTNFSGGIFPRLSSTTTTTTTTGTDASHINTTTTNVVLPNSTAFSSSEAAAAVAISSSETLQKTSYNHNNNVYYYNPYFWNNINNNNNNGPSSCDDSFRLVNDDDDDDDDDDNVERDNNNKNNNYDEESGITSTSGSILYKNKNKNRKKKNVRLSFAGEDSPLMSANASACNSSISYGDDDDNDKSKNNNDDDDEEHTTTIVEGISEVVMENIEYATEIAEHAWNNIEEMKDNIVEEYNETSHYNWKEYFHTGGGFTNFIRWFITGVSLQTKQSDQDIQDNLNSLARLLSLLREYYERFGMPNKGGPDDHDYILREITKDLYAGGAPLWTLEPVMRKVAEGLTGQRGVDFFLLPRRAFIFSNRSGSRGLGHNKATLLFTITRGYDISKLDAMERVAVRLASFASNTQSTSNIPARWPKPQELRHAFRTESLAGYHYSQEELSEEILSLASEAEGLFFYINSRKYRETHYTRDTQSYDLSHNTHRRTRSELDDFWTVEDTITELFSRLAAIEAIISIDKLDADRKIIYSRKTFALFRFGSSAAACAFWFNGSWLDVVVAGALAIFVAWIGASPVLSNQERIIFEAVASFAVGLIAGLVALHWPTMTCFGAIAISGVLDLLQGFRVVYSIIEIMSRNTVTGGADFFEGLFFTSLIAYFLKFGLYAATMIHGEPLDNAYETCDHGMNEWWYIVLVPFGAVCWSGLFNPNYYDLPFMAAHGVLGYVVSWQFYKAAPISNANNFLAAMSVTFCAGLVSRFTGRQALGNTVAGLYVLLPGAYLVTSVYENTIEGFLMTIIVRAVIIGLGAWTGTILCSPTLFGTNRGLLTQGGGIPAGSGHGSVRSDSSIASGSSWRRRDRASGQRRQTSLLYF